MDDSQGDAPLYMGPKEIQEQVDSAYAPNEGDLLNNQLLQAIALRQGLGQKHLTPAAAILGGLGDLMTEHQSRQQEKEIRGKQQGLLDTQKKAGLAFLSQQLQAQAAKADALRKLQVQSTPPDLTGAGAGDMGGLMGSGGV